MSKCLAIKTGENTLEPTAQTNNTLNAIKLALLQKQAEQGLGFNTREIIEESCDWTAPVTGVYKITCIDGGSGGLAANGQFLNGGYSGKIIERYKHLTKGQIIPVTIGAGGIGEVGILQPSNNSGGISSFGDISTNLLNMDNRTPSSSHSLMGTSLQSDGVRGGGRGGASHVNWNATSATFYGAGGSACFLSPNTYTVSDGFQGCIIVEYFDPEKASLPTINDTDLIPYLTLLQRLDTLEKQFAENAVYNDKILITESGEWEAPVTGWYKILAVGGGSGGHINYFPGSNNNISAAIIMNGASGSYVHNVIKLEKGEVVQVTIGAGGNGSIRNSNVIEIAGSNSGDTIFKNIIAKGANNRTFADAFTDNMCYLQNSWMSSYFTDSDIIILNGAGFGSSIDFGNTGNAENEKGLYYGAGGGARCAKDGYKYAGNGAPGCVILYFHNPNKNQGV